jgi:hypothetical protein
MEVGFKKEPRFLRIYVRVALRYWKISQCNGRLRNNPITHKTGVQSARIYEIRSQCFLLQRRLFIHFCHEIGFNIKGGAMSQQRLPAGSINNLSGYIIGKS